MIGSCDCCERQTVPISRGEVTGIETYACFICQGDTDPDPYNELEDTQPSIEPRDNQHSDNPSSMAAGPCVTGFFVKYRLSADDIARTDGGPFDTRHDAIDHRNWYFGHAPGVVACWVENRVGKRTGSLLQRKDQATA